MSVIIFLEVIIKSVFLCSQNALLSDSAVNEEPAIEALHGTETLPPLVVHQADSRQPYTQNVASTSLPVLNLNAALCHIAGKGTHRSANAEYFITPQ